MAIQERSSEQLLHQIRTTRTLLVEALEKRKEQTGKSRVRPYTRTLLEDTDPSLDLDGVIESNAHLLGDGLEKIMDPWIYENPLREYTHPGEIAWASQQARKEGHIFDEQRYIGDRILISDQEYKKRHEQSVAKQEKEIHDYLDIHEIEILSAVVRALGVALENVAVTPKLL